MRLSHQVTLRVRSRRLSHAAPASRGAVRVIAADFYQVLKVKSTASKADVKSAYRRALRQCHPDVDSSSDAQERFKLVSDAYSVLTSDSLRQRYNTLGVIGLGPKFAHYLDRGHRFAGPAERGGDVHAILGLGFLEAALGTERLVSLQVLGDCGGCGGVGVAPSSRNDACRTCSGLGEVLTTRRGGKGRGGSTGRMTSLSVCPGCGGSGGSVREYCSACGGQGRSREERKIKVRIPAGVDQDSVLRLRGRGDCGRWGGATGDVYIGFQVRPMDGVWRKGQDVYSTIEVGYVDAILGGYVSCHTIHGPVDLTIPPGLQHGRRLQLDGAGVRKEGGGGGGGSRAAEGGLAGKHVFEVRVTVPTEVSSGERELLEALRTLQQRKQRRRQRQRQQEQ